MRAMVGRIATGVEARVMLARRRPDRSTRPGRAGLRGLPRPIGLFAAALALAIQLAVVVAPMPGMTGAEALSGPHMLCWPSAPAKGKAGGQPGSHAGHDCPSCQILQQSMACLAPTPAVGAFLHAAHHRPPPLMVADRPARPAPSPAQPRAPPFLT